MELELGDLKDEKDAKRHGRNRDSSRRSIYTRLTNTNSDRSPTKVRNRSVVSITSEKKLDLDRPLHTAVRRGNCPEVIKTVESSSVSELINSLNHESLTPLHLAAKLFSKSLSQQITEILLKHGALVDIKTPDHSTALHFAVRYGNEEAALILIKHGANVGLTDINGASPLHFAASRGFSSLVQTMLDTKMVNINIQDAKYYSPLHYAAIGCHFETCKLLLSNGASTDVVNMCAETPWHLAAGEGNIDILKLLLDFKKNEAKEKYDGKKADLTIMKYINQPRNNELSAIHIATRMGNIDVMNFLTSEGADTSAVTTQKATVTHIAATIGNVAAMQTILNQCESSVNARDLTLRTPLHKAAIGGHIVITKMLLEKGADINAKDSRGRTPLLHAVQSNHKDLVTLLLDNGANSAAEDENLKTALHYAVENGNFALVMLISERNKKLVTSKDCDNMTALHYAAEMGHSKILRLILSKTMYALDADSSGQTALHLAAKNGHASCIPSLAAEPKAATVNIQNLNGETPLHLAVINKHLDACKSLVENEADINIEDNTNWTPLHYAVSQYDVDILDVLLQGEADVDAEDNRGYTPLMVAAEAGNAISVTRLMDVGANLEKLNQDGNTFFDIAIDLQRKDVCEEILQHDRWQEALSSKGTNGNHFMSKLIEVDPVLAELVLDRSCSFSNHQPDHPDFTVTFDFQYLEECPISSSIINDVGVILKGGRNEFYFAPTVMARNGRQQLMSHPIVKSIFAMKWKRVGRYFYYLSFLLYLMFLVSLNISVILESQSFVLITIQNRKNETNTKKLKGLNSLLLNRPSSKRFGMVLGYFIVVFCSLQIVKEIVQLIVLRYKYFLSFVNYLEMTLYCSSIYYIVSFLAKTRLTKAGYEIGCICVFLGWVNVLLFLQRVPTFRILIVMFIQVCTTILKVILVFSTVIISFSLTFYMMFVRQTTFRDLGVSTIKALVMMTGEFDYDTVVTGNLNTRDATKFPLVPFPALSYVMVILFIFLVALAFMNLLIGLAVGDIESIKELANLIVQMQQLDYIISINGILPKYFIQKFIYTRQLSWPVNRDSRLERFIQSLTSDTTRDELLNLRLRLLDMEDRKTVPGAFERGFGQAVANEKIDLLQKLVVRQQKMYEDVMSGEGRAKHTALGHSISLSP